MPAPPAFFKLFPKFFPSIGSRPGDEAANQGTTTKGDAHMARKRSNDGTPDLFGFDFTPASTVAESIATLDRPVFNKGPDLFKETEAPPVELAPITVI